MVDAHKDLGLFFVILFLIGMGCGQSILICSRPNVYWFFNRKYHYGNKV